MVHNEQAKAAGENRALFLAEDDQISATAFNEQYTKLARGHVEVEDPLMLAAEMVAGRKEADVPTPAGQKAQEVIDLREPGRASGRKARKASAGA